MNCYQIRAPLAAALLALCTQAHAAPSPDCGPLAPAQHVLAAYDLTIGAYCVSDFGISNTYYYAGANGGPPFPAVYTPSADLFSGDDAVNLQFKVSGTPRGGSGWLSPYLDAGSLAPAGYATGSAWSVVSPVHYVTANQTNLVSSTIQLVTLGSVLRVTIDTRIASSGSVTQIYTLQNTGTTAITDLVFADYFNFHPNGSEAAASQLGTTRFANNRIYTSGDHSDPGLIVDGNMRLINAATGATLTPSAHDVGCADILLLALECGTGAATITRVENGGFNNAVAPAGPGDYGGALAYLMGGLAVGQSVQIGVVKEVPEPARGWLLLAGIGLLAVTRSVRRSRLQTDRDAR